MCRIALNLLFTVCVLWTAHGSAADSATPANKTKAEVIKLIDTEGAKPPPWLAGTKLNYPKTLGLRWERAADKEPWTPTKYTSQYIWSVINENPGRWKEGLQFLYLVLETNKDDPVKTVTSQRAIARHYQHLLNDPLRAAYWWRKSVPDNSSEHEALALANCYLKLGSKEAAMKIAKDAGEDDTRQGDLIKLWGDMGEYDTALKLADTKASLDDADVAYLMAGETHRLKGDYKSALESYQKVLKVDPKKGSRDNKQVRARAQASMDAIKTYDAFDMKKIADGTYASDSYGYSGQVYVSATVAAGKITDIKITKHTEKQYYGSLTETPAKIIAKQSIKGIDTFSSATITSEAIINAAAKALAKGNK